MVSNQGKVVLGIQAIQILTALIAIMILPTTALVKFFSAMSVLFFMGLGALVTFVSINCMVVGDCNLWAWAIVGFLLVSFVFAMVSSVGTFVLLKNKTMDEIKSLVPWGHNKQAEKAK